MHDPRSFSFVSFIRWNFFFSVKDEGTVIATALTPNSNDQEATVSACNLQFETGYAAVPMRRQLKNRKKSIVRNNRSLSNTCNANIEDRTYLDSMEDKLFGAGSEISINVQTQWLFFVFSGENINLISSMVRFLFTS